MKLKYFSFLIVLFVIRDLNAQVPVADFTITSPSCTSKTLNVVDLSINSPTSWSYTMTGGSPTISAVQNPTVTYMVYGTYSITLIASNVSGSSAPVTKTLTIGSSTTSASNTGPFCEGTTIILNAISFTPTSYTWTGPGGFTSNIQNPTIANCTATMAGVYTVIENTGGTCTTSASTSVTVMANPTLLASSSSSMLCSGQTATLSTSGTATSYSWNTGATTASISVNPTVTTTYTVTGIVTNTMFATSCYTTVTITQSVSSCLGIENSSMTNIDFAIYPNPSDENINIISLQDLSQFSYEIFSVTGSKIDSGKISENINISRINDGVYILEIRKPEGILIGWKKIIRH